MPHHIAARWTGSVSVPRMFVLLQESPVQCLRCAFWQRCCQHCRGKEAAWNSWRRCGTKPGSHSHLLSSALRLNLPWESITSLTKYLTGGKSGNGITGIGRKIHRRRGSGDPKTARSRERSSTCGWEERASQKPLPSGLSFLENWALALSLLLSRDDAQP